MANTEERELQKKSKGGMLVIGVLALIFFTLLLLLVFKSPDDGPRRTTGPAELYVVPLKMRIRTQPSARSAIVEHVARGERLPVLETREAWVRVKTPGGLVGWGERSALETAQERERRLARTKAIRNLAPLDGVMVKESVLYAGPGLFYPVLGELRPQTRVRVYTRDHDFFAIDADGGIAYVEIDDVDLASPGVEFDVAATDEAATATATETVPDEVADASTEEEPLPDVAVPPVESVPDKIGVYEAVPAGGSEPDVLRRVVPDYPMRARRAGVAGTVVLRGIVRRDGSIDEVEVLRDLPHGLGDAARRAVRRWRFRPATYKGEKIDVYYTVTVNFKLAG
jgi:TonB family protein